MSHALFRFTEPNIHTLPVCNKWTISRTECYYPNSVTYSKARLMLVNEAEPFEEGDWEAFNGVLLKQNSM
jgi:hypothetical protein